MESARSETVTNHVRRKRKSLLMKLQMSVLVDEFANVKLSKVTIESRDTTLRKDVVPLFPKCKNKLESVEKVKLVTKSNSFRKTVTEKEKVISDLKQAMTKLESDLKNV